MSELMMIRRQIMLLRKYQKTDFFFWLGQDTRCNNKKERQKLTAFLVSYFFLGRYLQYSSPSNHSAQAECGDSLTILSLLPWKVLEQATFLRSSNSDLHY